MRPFLTLFSLALSLIGLLRPASAEEPVNILWISCEDLSPRLGCYGDPTVAPTAIGRRSCRSWLAAWRRGS